MTLVSIIEHRKAERTLFVNDLYQTLDKFDVPIAKKIWQ